MPGLAESVWLPREFYVACRLVLVLQGNEEHHALWLRVGPIVDAVQ